MRAICAKMSTVHRVTNHHGDVFVVPSEVIPGIIHFERHVDVQRHIGVQQGILEVVFAFATREGAVCRYRSFVSVGRLWPTPSTTVCDAIEAFKSDVWFRDLTLDMPVSTLLSWRDRGAVSRSDSVCVTAVQMRPERENIAVRLYFNSDESGTARNSCVCIDYSMEYESVLWHNGPVLLPDQLLVEGADYVPVMVIGQLGDAGMPSELLATGIDLFPCVH